MTGNDNQCGNNFIRNELLTYVQYYLDKSTKENIKLVLTRFYTEEDVEDVQRAIKKLHRGKSDWSRGFTSDHLLHCSVACISAISSMMNSMLSHGYCPTVFLESYIISIPKNNKGSLTTSNNYRGISLCNALTKVLDLIIIDKHHYLLNSSHL